MVRGGSDEREQEQGCILLFGLPRSGTTWLGKLFDSHPDTLYRHEPDSWHMLPMPRFPGAAEAGQYAALLRSFVAELPHINALRVAGKLPLFPKSYLSPSRARMIQASIWLARLGAQFGRDIPVLMHSAVANYPRRRVVWKSIESLGRTGAILGALPNTTGIHILRHPCGCIASQLRGHQGGQLSGMRAGIREDGILSLTLGTPLGDSYDLSRKMLAELTPEEQFAWRWVLINEKAQREGKESGRMLTICYEDLCQEPMAHVEQVFEFTGLAVPEQTRAFVAASTSRSRDSYYSVFKDSVAAANRWRQELDMDTIERVMAIVRRSPFAEQYDMDPIVSKATP